MDMGLASLPDFQLRYAIYDDGNTSCSFVLRAPPLDLVMLKPHSTALTQHGHQALCGILEWCHEAT